MSVYRPPSTDSQAGLCELQHIVTELSLVCQYVVVAGDLNINLCSSSTIATAYSEFVSDNNLVQHIAEPSRVTATSATLIDHILTTPNIVVDSVCQSVGLSDHLVQILNANLFVVCQKPSTFSIRSFRKCDWSAVRDSLASTPWQVMDVLDDVDDMWHYFMASLFSVLDEYAPLKSIKSKFSKRPTPWLTPELLMAIKEKNKAKRHAVRTGDPHDLAAEGVCS